MNDLEIRLASSLRHNLDPVPTFPLAPERMRRARRTRVVTATASVLMIAAISAGAVLAVPRVFDRPPPQGPASDPDLPGDTTRQEPGDLWSNTFVSTEVTEDGESRSLVSDTRISVTFEEREDGGFVRWEAGCNTLGADVEVTDEQLLVGTIGGTEMGCPDELQEQDEWVTDFFRSNPDWELNDDRFTLTSDGTVIELEANNQ
jgi:heat shock protein HslJ